MKIKFYLNGQSDRQIRERRFVRTKKNCVKYFCLSFAASEADEKNDVGIFVLHFRFVFLLVRNLNVSLFFKWL